MKLLLIEDDRSIGLALKQVLAGTISVDLATSGGVGLAKALSGEHDVVVLDLNLPDINGLQVCEKLRSNGFGGAILVLTGENSIISKIKLLDAGADDYLTKPFSLGEFKARLRALERRHAGKQPARKQLCVAGLKLDGDTFLVERDGQSIKLRRKEFAVLQCLMEHAGSVVTREALGDHAWSSHDSPWANTIDVHIKHLRDKIDRPFGEPLIRTIHGLGYKLEAPTAVAKQA